MIRVLLADDQSLVRAEFKALLDAQSDTEVAGEAADGGEALRKARELRPDVVLMDIRMPVLDGLAATRRITDGRDDLVVVLMSTYTADDLPRDAADCGAARYVHKEDLAPQVLVDAWEHRSA